MSCDDSYLLPVPLYEALPGLMLSLLTKTKAGTGTQRSAVARFSWFLLDLVVKSMLLHLGTAASNSLPADASPDGREKKVTNVKQAVLDTFKSLVKQLTDDVIALGYSRSHRGSPSSHLCVICAVPRKSACRSA